MSVEEEYLAESSNDKQEVASASQEGVLLSEKKKYANFSMGELLQELKRLLKDRGALKRKSPHEDIRKAFDRLVEEDKKIKLQDYLAMGGEPMHFVYHHAAGDEFSEVLHAIKQDMYAHQQRQEEQQEESLKKRQTLIERLKDLYTSPDADSQQVFNEFKAIKEQWIHAGTLSKAHAGEVFRNYHHHLNNFYEFLKINRELRELEHRHNHERRLAILEEAKLLIDEPNYQKAFNEIQYLHQLWKKAYPVDKELNDSTWKEFRALTKQINDRREGLDEKTRERRLENLNKKEEVLSLLRKILEDKASTHKQWQNNIQYLEELRKIFLAVGPVPKEEDSRIWETFKVLMRDFNHEKNEYYRGIKKEQSDNLQRKQALLQQALVLKDSEDWETTPKALIDIQAQWRTIGHVPRKYSNDLWKDFKTACNTFFDRFHALKDEKQKKGERNYKKKLDFLESLNRQTFPAVKEEAMAILTTILEQWKAMGSVATQRSELNKKFEKGINKLCQSLTLSDTERRELELKILESQIVADRNERKQEDEILAVRRYIQGLEQEINQKENNLGFFARSSGDSPLLKETKKSIEEAKQELARAKQRHTFLCHIEVNKAND